MEAQVVNQTFESNPGVMFKLGQLEAKLDSISEKLDDKVAGHEKDIDALQKDVSMLKGWRMWTLGFSAAVGVIAGFIVKVIPIG
jgi:hypothetical protein